MSIATKTIYAVGVAAALTACTAAHQQASTQPNAQPQVREGECDDGCCLCNDVGDRVFFTLNSTRLTPEAVKTLNKQANWLQKYPVVKVLFAGNCDERGTEEYNIALGYRRAKIARDFLIAKGVQPPRIAIVSYGKSHPIALASNEQAWSQNRNAIATIRNPSWPLDPPIHNE